MKCENVFCVYWSENRCVLDEVELDVQGRCNSLIYLDLEENFLKNIREAQLNGIEKR